MVVPEYVQKLADDYGLIFIWVNRCGLYHITFQYEVAPSDWTWITKVGPRRNEAPRY